jgi:acyl-CoA synthetase (NDP forming)
MRLRAAPVSLERLLQPATVALIGASGTPGKWGYMMMRTLLDGGFGGEIAAVNGRGGEVQGHPAYPTVADLPWAPDVALVTVGREACVEAVEALAVRGCRHAVLYAAGFAELGVDGARLQDRMVHAARATGMRLLGPNCMSLFVARSRLNLTGIPDLRPGRLAFVSQSGNLVYDLVEHGRRSGLGLSLFLSLGNQADLGFEDVLDAALADPDTGAAALYIEAVRPGRGRAFLEALHRLARAKPVVALIGGRTDTGRRASASHTAALLSDVRELRGLLRQAGAIEVTRLDELFPVADALLKSPPPPVATVALCGGGGGHATVGSDALEAHGIAVPPPAPETQQALRAIFPPIASVRNPIDWTGASDRSFWAYRDAAQLLLGDRGIGGLILFGHFGGYLTELETPANNYKDVAGALGQLQRETGKPILLHSIYALQRREAFDALRDAGVPLFESLEVTGAAYRALVERARPRGPLPAIEAGADERLAPHAARARSEGRQALLEPEAGDWLESLGIAVGPRCWARTAEDAVAFAAVQAAPVAVKLVSAGILHKSDVGGVRLDVDGPDAVRRAFADLEAVAHTHRADFRGVLVVPMAGPGVDVVLGVARSELGGHVLLAGSGGTVVEALDDASVRPMPLTVTDAADMLGEARIARVLARPRGIPPPALAPLHDLMVRLAAGTAGSVWLEAVDLNPVRVGAEGVRILDARVLLAS